MFNRSPSRGSPMLSTSQFTDTDRLLSQTETSVTCRTLLKRAIVSSSLIAFVSFGPSAIADASKPHSEAAAQAANATVLAAQIVSRWAPVAEAAGLNAAVWQEQFTMQLVSMSVSNLQSLDRLQVKSDADAQTSYAQFAQAFRSALMMKYIDGQAEKANEKRGSTTTDQMVIPIVPCRDVHT